MKHWIAIATVVVTASIGFGQSLEEKTQRKEEDEILQKATVEVNKDCESKIKATFDWPSFGGKLKKGGSHVGLNCATAFEVIGRMCRSDNTSEIKPAVQKGITEFRCVGSGGKDASATMKGKTIIFATHVDNTKRFDMQTFVLKSL